MKPTLGEDYEKYFSEKAAIVSGLIIILMIALSMIFNVISERCHYKQAAKHNIAKSWTGEQKLIGPVLVVSYYVEKPKTILNKALNKDVVEVSVVLG